MHYTPPTRLSGNSPTHRLEPIPLGTLAMSVVKDAQFLHLDSLTRSDHPDQLATFSAGINLGNDVSGKLGVVS